MFLHYFYHTFFSGHQAPHPCLSEKSVRDRPAVATPWPESQLLIVCIDHLCFILNTHFHSIPQFSPDITPLILASQKNQYEIVQLLLLRGEKVQKPHKFGCLCQECVNKMKFDQLRSAKYRLNAYRGLASEAYISLSSKDPILTAFQLSKELRLLSRNEKYFKVIYTRLYLTCCCRKPHCV